MAQMTLIRSDGRGLFVRVGGYEARPGEAVGYSHAYAMDDGGLVVGTKAKAGHLAGSPLVRIETPKGLRYWHTSRSYAIPARS